LTIEFGSWRWRAREVHTRIKGDTKDAGEMSIINAI
jgi:hypothetical protein